MVSISVCMIVRNEEHVLARCLDSLCGLYDELIIVDTGSVDATKEIAKRYTNHIYDFKWVNDFSSARNFSLSKAQCDYIYTADADEIINEENRQLFLQLKNVLLPEVEVVEMAYENQLSHCTTSNFNVEFRPKLFRRLRTFQFADPIHEVLRIDPIVYRSNVCIEHHPTSGHSQRDLAQLAHLTEQGSTLSSRLEMMYARELLIGGTADDFKAAFPYFKQVRNNLNKPPEALRRASCVLAFGYALLQDGEQLLCYAAPELVGQPPAEICCALGYYFLNKKEAQQASDWYSAALSGAQPELIASSVGKIPLEGLAACFRLAGNDEQAALYAAQAEAWSPECLNPETTF